jgi:hypothetical protein
MEEIACFINNYQLSWKNISKRNYIKRKKNIIDEETLFAKISHFPNGRIGNILLCPSFTEIRISAI